LHQPPSVDAAQVGDHDLVPPAGQGRRHSREDQEDELISRFLNLYYLKRTKVFRIPPPQHSVEPFVEHPKNQLANINSSTPHPKNQQRNIDSAIRR
jgi:hypothetical protein